MKKVVLSRTGRLFSFTTVRVRPPYFIGEVPYLLGIVEMPEGERIRTLLTECDQDTLEIGMEMELVIEKAGRVTQPIGKVDAGTDVLGWKFRPRRRR